MRNAQEKLTVVQIVRRTCEALTQIAKKCNPHRSAAKLQIAHSPNSSNVENQKRSSELQVTFWLPD